MTATYVYAGGIDHPVKVIKGGIAFFFQQDALGDVTALTDNAGAIVEQYSYDAFGKPTIKDGSGIILAASLTPFLFTGREYDSETGLYHYRTRAYSSTLGRFLQPDSISFNGGDINIYRYVGNNPISGNDPLGLASISVQLTGQTSGHVDLGNGNQLIVPANTTLTANNDGGTLNISTNNRVQSDAFYSVNPSLSYLQVDSKGNYLNSDLQANYFLSGYAKDELRDTINNTALSSDLALLKQVLDLQDALKQLNDTLNDLKNALSPLLNNSSSCPQK